MYHSNYFSVYVQFSGATVTTVIQELVTSCKTETVFLVSLSLQPLPTTILLVSVGLATIGTAIGVGSYRIWFIVTELMYLECPRLLLMLCHAPEFAAMADYSIGCIYRILFNPFTCPWALGHGHLLAFANSAAVVVRVQEPP